MTAARAKSPEVVTFGCRLNAYESEVIRQQNAFEGGEDTIVFNTCAVTNEAVRQARQAIRKAGRANPQARRVVTGCAAQIDPRSFADMPEVSAVLGNEEKMSANGFRQDFGVIDAEKIRVNDIMSVKETAGHLVAGFEGRARAFVQIQNGCDHRCTFCIIPFGRGNSRSVPAGAVVDQVRKLVEFGHKEVVLTGVDITSYGADLPGAPTLGVLVGKILAGVPDLARLRLSSLDSVEVDERLFDLITGEVRVMPHLHLSLQAGDDLTLKRMKRRHTRAQSVAFCDAVRAKRPEIAFGADLIAGFPTETDGMFENSVALIDDCGIAYTHIFPFSAKQGTPAARMPQAPGNIVKERAARLRAAGARNLSVHLAARVGRTVQVLMETETSGHAEDFSPVRFDAAQVAGSLVDAKVARAAHDHLIAVAR